MEITLDKILKFSILLFMLSVIINFFLIVNINKQQVIIDTLPTVKVLGLEKRLQNE